MIVLIAALAGAVLGAAAARRRRGNRLDMLQYAAVYAILFGLGGMALSIAGMIFAAFGLMSPLQGAIAQEVIDVVAVLNALRAAFPPGELVDHET